MGKVWGGVFVEGGGLGVEVDVDDGGEEFEKEDKGD